MLAALVSACGTVVYNDVTRFHTLAAKPNGQTFALAPYEKQNGSLEFQQYARLVASRMAALGYREVAPDASPALLVFIDYGINRGRTVTSSSPVFGQTGGGTTSYHSGSVTSGTAIGSYTGSTYTPPTFGIVGYEATSSTVYLRHLAMHIVDVQKSTPKSAATIFEGNVKSEGSVNSLPRIMPYLIEALFTNFPGKSGETTTVTLPLKDG